MAGENAVFPCEQPRLPANVSVMPDTERPRERFTARLEAFSDLVFGFSLSLLATRLDMPAHVEEVFEPARWFAIIGTFGLVCQFWLAHYRIFRHEFVAQMFDAVVNFIFLFAVAILPYSLQIFLRFRSVLPSFALYVSDLALVLISLSILRVRSLLQRRGRPGPSRLKEWRRTIIQGTVALVTVALLVALRFYPGSFQDGINTLGSIYAAIIVLVVVATRRLVKRLPGFLESRT